MRILVATDGSEPGDRAVRLVAAQPWPEGSALRVLVVDDGRALSSEFGAGPPTALDVFGAGIEDLIEIARSAAGDLEGHGWSIEFEVIRGRAASVIVDDAARFEADLIVMGSRERGRLGSLALGSVSAEVVDHAGRPVLVGRGEDRFERVVLGDDGSDSAAVARTIVARWPVFQGATVALTGVVHVPAPLHSAISPSIYRVALQDYARTLDLARSQRDQVLAASAAELRTAGRSVATVPREGDPATEIVAVAADQKAQLIVVGSRGETGLSRLLLGSVARNVLYEATCSVLIAR